MVLLTCGALLTLVVEATGTFRAPGQASWSLGLAGVYALVAIVGFAWVQGRGRRFAVGSLAVSDLSRRLRRPLLWYAGAEALLRNLGEGQQAA